VSITVGFGTVGWKTGKVTDAGVFPPAVTPTPAVSP
jgi:hypothetical protein